LCYFYIKEATSATVFSPCALLTLCELDYLNKPMSEDFLPLLIFYFTHHSCELITESPLTFLALARRFPDRGDRLMILGYLYHFILHAYEFSPLHANYMRQCIVDLFSNENDIVEPFRNLPVLKGIEIHTPISKWKTPEDGSKYDQLLQMSDKHFAHLCDVTRESINRLEL
jgi:hypothetical protein